jgi:DNA invertase Pin-like site-specific DNA recombinase
MAHLLMNILSSFAEFERELISERICASIAHQRSKGHPRYIQAETIQRAKSLRAQGYSLRRIAKELNLSHGSAQRLAAKA